MSAISDKRSRIHMMVQNAGVRGKANRKYSKVFYGESVVYT